VEEPARKWILVTLIISGDMMLWIEMNLGLISSNIENVVGANS